MTSTATTFEQIAPSSIKPHPSNHRAHVGDVDELADSIKAQGVLEPLIVAPITDNARSKKYLLIAGHRRLAAAKAAKIKTVPAVVRADLDTTSKQLEAMLVENLHRVDLSPIEEGDAYQALLDLGDYTQAKIAKATGRSKKVVSDRLKVSKLPESVRDRILPGQITLADALAMAEFVDDPDTFTALEEAAGTHNFGWRLQSARAAKARAKERAATLKALAAEGVTVLDDYPDDGPCVELLDLVPADRWPADPGDEDNDEVVLDRFREEHQSCPGHAVVVDEYTGEPEYLCTRPDLHPAEDKPARDVDAGEPPADRTPPPEELQRRQDEEDLAAVAKARRAYLGTIVLADDNQDMATAIVRDHLEECLTHPQDRSERRTLAQILYQNPDAISDDDLPDQLRGTLRTLPLSALVILQDLDISRDRWLEHPGNHNWQGEWSPTRHWRDHLVRLGYEWTDVELRMLGDTTTDDGEDPADEDGVA